MSGKEEVGFWGHTVRTVSSVKPVPATIAPDISASARRTHKWSEAGFRPEVAGGKKGAWVCDSGTKPTARQLGARLTSLERGDEEVVLAGGMAAIGTLLIHLLAPSDHHLFGDVTYTGAAEFVRDLLQTTGIEATFADMSNLSGVVGKVRTNTKVIYAESPSNPLLKLVDVEGLSRIAERCGAYLVIDTTFTTPALSRPALDLAIAQ